MALSLSRYELYCYMQILPAEATLPNYLTYILYSSEDSAQTFDSAALSTRLSMSGMQYSYVTLPLCRSISLTRIGL